MKRNIQNKGALYAYKRCLAASAIGLSTLLTLTFGTLKAQQQFSYTQYIDNLTPIIPSWSLTRTSGELNVLGRHQWVGIEGAPRTYMFSGFLPFGKANSSAGISMMSDKVAVEKLTEFNAFFAKGINLDKGTILSVSLNGGFRRYTAPYSTLAPTDPTFTNADIDENEFNMGASVLLFSEKFYAGISMPRLSLRKLGFGSTLDTKIFNNYYYFTAGYKLQLNEDFHIQSSALLAYTANVPLQGDITLKAYLKNNFGLGLDYRTNNEIGLLTSFNISNIRFGYSYLTGFGKKKVAGIQQATHEIAVGFLLVKGSSSEKSKEKTL